MAERLTLDRLPIPPPRVVSTGSEELGAIRGQPSALDQPHPLELLDPTLLRRLTRGLDTRVASQLWARVLVGLAAGIAPLLDVDRILDMSRTAVNVAGDLTAGIVIQRGSGEAVTLPPRSAASSQDARTAM